MTSDTNRHDRLIPKDAKYFRNKSGDLECQICHDVGLEKKFISKKESRATLGDMKRHIITDHEKKLVMEKVRKRMIIMNAQNPSL